MRQFGIMVMGLLMSMQLFAQDPDFSQYYATPLSLNPALTGTFNGTYRVGGIYRDAWRVASPVPLATYVFNGEYRFRLGNEKKNSDYGSAGVKFFSDRTPLVEQNTNAISALFAFHKSLSQFSKQYLSLGFEFGLAQKNINYENLYFEDQFNNINAFDNITGEDLQPNNFAYADFAIGLNYSYEINKKNNLYIGLSGKHLSTPNLSFWGQSDNNDPNLVKENNLPIHLGFQLSSRNVLNYRLTIFPRIITQIQGPHTQAFMGSTVRYNLDTNNDSALHFGGFIRVSNSETSISLAHFTPFVGFEVNDMLLGISYDVNTHDLSNNIQGIGVLELSITYTGEVIEDSAFCPQF